MLTPTGIINNTTWEELSSPFRLKPLQVRRYWLPRPRSAFGWIELLLLAAVAPAVWLGSGFEIPTLAVSCLIFVHVRMLDRNAARSKLVRFGLDAAEAASFGPATAAALWRFFPALAAGILPRFPGFEGIAAVSVAAACLPLASRPILRRLMQPRRAGEGILIVGTGDLAARLYDDLAGEREREADGHWRRRPGAATESGATALDLARLPEIVARERISRVVIAEKNAEHRRSLADALVDSRLRGVQVHDAVDFYEELFGKIWVDGLHSEWFVYSGGFQHSRVNTLLKRLIDVTLAATLLVLSAPFLAIVALIIKLESKGPVLFRQVRVGLHGQPFVLCKFRSMCDAAEARVGPVWTVENDPRITRVGRFLRKFRVDELPQLLNVLRGEMSVVGPRPERPYFVSELSKVIPYYNLRQYVKPGITGWAQVSYGYGASVEDAHEKLQYDIYYAKHHSLRCDLKILMRTVKIVLLGRGR